MCFEQDIISIAIDIPHFTTLFEIYERNQISATDIGVLMFTLTVNEDHRASITLTQNTEIERERERETRTTTHTHARTERERQLETGTKSYFKRHTFKKVGINMFIKRTIFGPLKILHKVIIN